ncbi:ATP-binding protein [Algoriphagus hitonicola]|uniref:AAA+ ATPase domain-containing protein n=1 Tax=Algoriphagus hitonicola TaxID=435880 RepID=A0A1I2W1L8_9BACT|nr:ATP-binding protein [Algoriphagus hitonicola]SFG95270.1 hypothetical protein SAMN04487988_11195 [Algoriphagus hitonicola]
MRRKLYQSLDKHLTKKEFTVLTGARQTGKSTLLHQLNQKCKEESIPSVFLNLENKDILRSLDASPLNLLSFFVPSDQRTIVFIDEVQYLTDPSNFLKLLYDEYRDQIKIVASGSSAFYLDEKFKDSLAGRKRVFRLNTCDFEDYLLIQGLDDLWQEVLNIRSVSNYRTTFLDRLWVEWERFMIYGGYPRVVMEPDLSEKKEILKEIRDSFIKRDILESGIKNELVFYQLFKILAQQSGQLLNINELSNTLRTRSETIQNYLQVLTVCFHISLVRPFFSNLRKELVKMPKVYLLDNGLRNSLINNFQPLKSRSDRGELWEQTFFKILADKNDLDEIRFWRTADGKEIDFVLPELASPTAHEVKLDTKQIKKSKYKQFELTYPQFEVKYQNLFPWSEDFFRSIVA